MGKKCFLFLSEGMLFGNGVLIFIEKEVIWVSMLDWLNVVRE